jgi:hypothetical protein
MNKGLGKKLWQALEVRVFVFTSACTGLHSFFKVVGYFGLK